MGGPKDRPGESEEGGVDPLLSDEAAPPIRDDGEKTFESGWEPFARMSSGIRRRSSSDSGILAVVRSRGHVNDVLAEMQVEDNEKSAIYKLLGQWGVNQLSSLEVIEDEALLRKTKLIAELHKLIPGSRFLTNHFFEQYGQKLEGTHNLFGVVLKVDLSGFTKSLAESEALEGDASVLAQPIDEDLTMVTNVCRAYGFSLISLGGDAATFVSVNSRALEQAELATKLISDMCPMNVGGVDSGISSTLNHDFKALAVEGEIEMKVIRAASDRSLLRISGAALSSLDDREKSVAAGASEVTSMLSFPVVDDFDGILDAVTSLDSFVEFSMDNIHAHMDSLIDYLETFLRTDFSISSVLDSDLSMQVRDHSVVMMNLRGLDAEQEPAFFEDVFHQISLLGGVIYKVEGDVLIALFPKHIASDGYKRNAYDFAQHCLMKYPEFPASVASGTLLEASLGPEDSQEWGALGIAINRAARIMVHCSTTGLIAVDGETYMSIKDYVDQEVDSEIRDDFKGLGATKVVRVSGVAKNAHRPISLRLREFACESVGREDQLADVGEVIEAHCEGLRSSSVYLRGTAGSGKRMFLAKAFSQSSGIVTSPFLEHDGVLFQRPYVGCVSLLQNVLDYVDDIDSLELDEGERTLLDNIVAGDISLVSSPSILQQLFVTVLNSLSAIGITDLTLLVANVNFWDPPSVDVLNGVHRYFMGTGDVRVLFVFTENTSVNDTRSEERAEFLSEFDESAKSSGVSLDLRPFDESETEKLIKAFALDLGPALIGVHEEVVSFIHTRSNGNPADIKRLTEILVREGILTTDYGVDILGKLRVLEGRGDLYGAGLSLTYIDYLGFENSEEVKSFVRNFALLGSSFPLSFLRAMVRRFNLGVNLSRNLDVVIGRLVSNGILSLDDEMVTFKHPGTRTDFRDSIPKATKKVSLLKAIRAYDGADDHLVKISRFHWIKELIEIANGSAGPALKSELNVYAIGLGVDICSDLATNPGNQASIIYYSNTVINNAEGIDTRRLSPKLRRDLAGLHSFKAAALLGIGTTDKAMLAEDHYLKAVRLSDLPSDAVRNLIGVVRAQVMREVDSGLAARRARTQDLELSTIELETLCRDLEVEEDLNAEAKLVSSTIKFRILAQSGAGVSELLVYIDDLEELLNLHSDYLDRNLPMKAWLFYSIASLHDARAMSVITQEGGKRAALDLAARREAFSLSLEFNRRAFEIIDTYPNTNQLMRVFPNIADPAILSRRSAMNLAHTFDSPDERGVWVDVALGFSEMACDLSERAGARSNLIKALEGRNLALIATGNTDAVAETNARILKVARLIGSKKYVASAEFIAVLCEAQGRTGLKFLEFFIGRFDQERLRSEVSDLSQGDREWFSDNLSGFSERNPSINDAYVGAKFEVLTGMCK
jgi:hypothetical protein